MEGAGRKPTGTGSSSSTGSNISNDLFGPKGGSGSTGKPNSSTGIFDSVFSNPSTYSRTEAIGSWRKKESGENQGWKSKGNTSQASEGHGQNAYNKGRSSIFQDDKAEPHYLSSSLYYGGQDVYSNPSETRSSPSPHTYKKKDGEDDDPNGSNLHSASRGNWWQGGLYY
ncbi:hypothetical protein ACHQM5_020078 [Ranunculus cassubicifolius]